MIADATPDISKHEQNVMILRYVFKDEKLGKFEIFERFIAFIIFDENTGEGIANQLILELENSEIPIADCRGQGYDNGANMSGKVKGVQARFIEKNNLALYSPYAAHSLNLIGVNAAKICPKVVIYFGYVQQFFVFFSSSTLRWSILKDELEAPLHSQSHTRWSSRVDAICPVAKQLKIINALDRVMSELSCTLPEKCHSEIKLIQKYFTSFKAIVLSNFWYKILTCIDQRNVIIQKRGISLNDEINLESDLKKDLQNLRNSWPQVILESQKMAREMKIMPNFLEPGRRIKKRKLFFDENTIAKNLTLHISDENNEPENLFKVEVIYCTIDFILSDLEHRFQAVKNMCTIFEPLLNYVSLPNEELQIKTKKLVEKYNLDLSENMCDEILHLKTIYSSTFQKSTEMHPLELLNSI